VSAIGYLSRYLGEAESRGTPPSMEASAKADGGVR
jgi:hypothetical protein